MDILTIAVWVVLTFTLLIGLTYLPKRGKNYPPGPTPWPIIGNLHLLGKHPQQSLAKLAKKHGPIMSLKLGQVTTIVVSSAETAKEVLKTHDLIFSSRYVRNAVHAHNEYQYSVIWLPVDSQWRTLRKILNTNIFSVKRLDDNQYIRQRKVQDLVDFCRKSSETGDAVDIGRAGFRTTLNLLSNTIFSKDLTDLSSESARDCEFRELVWKIMVEAGKSNMGDFFPILAKIDPQGIRRQMGLHFGRVLEIFSELIDERLKSGISNGDMLDVLLTTCKQSPELLERKHIEVLCLNLFGAGTDTTSSTMEWAMSELFKNPDKMKKTQEEIAQVVGKGVVLKDADVAGLPYLRCVIKETLRIHPPVPFLVPRRLMEDVEVCGYNVPKDSQVFVNVWAIGKDEASWEDPFTFKPERFLESKLDTLGQDFEFLPFGSGRRICPGFPLALRMIHVMLGSLVNCFDWKLEGDTTPETLDMSEKSGMTLQKARSLLVVPLPLSIT